MRQTIQFECIPVEFVVPFITYAFAKSLAKKYVLRARNPCLKNLFPNCRSVILSTSPRICQHEDIWPIRAWYQNLVSFRNGGIKGISPQASPPFPLPQGIAGLASLADIFPIWPRFLSFSPTAGCGAWFQAKCWWGQCVLVMRAIFRIHACMWKWKSARLQLVEKLATPLH